MHLSGPPLVGGGKREKESILCSGIWVFVPWAKIKIYIGIAQSHVGGCIRCRRWVEGGGAGCVFYVSGTHDICAAADGSALRERLWVSWQMRLCFVRRCMRQSSRPAGQRARRPQLRAVFVKIGVCVFVCLFVIFLFCFVFPSSTGTDRIARIYQSQKPFPPLPHPRLAGSLFNIFVCLLFMRLLYTETHYVKISRRRRKSSTILYLYYTKLN